MADPHAAGPAVESWTGSGHSLSDRSSPATAICAFRAELETTWPVFLTEMAVKTDKGLWVSCTGLYIGEVGECIDGYNWNDKDVN